MTRSISCTIRMIHLAKNALYGLLNAMSSLYTRAGLVKCRDQVSRFNLHYQTSLDFPLRSYPGIGGA